MAELGYPLTKQQARAKLELLAKGDTDEVFVAVGNGDVVGVVTVHLVPLFHKEGNSARITALVVTGQVRRQGVGPALMSAAEKFAWAHDAIQIEVTSGDNRGDAHRFYESIGYRLDSRRFLKVR